MTHESGKEAYRKRPDRSLCTIASHRRSRRARRRSARTPVGRVAGDSDRWPVV